MSTHYVPGSGLAIVVDGTAALLPDGAEPSMVQALWSSLLSGGPLTDHLQVLLAPGLAAAPAFALVRVADRTAQVVARGSALVVVASEAGEQVVSASQVSTWTEASVSDVTAVRLAGVHAGSGPSLPVAAAVVPASVVTLVPGALVGRAVATTPAAAAKPAAPVLPPPPPPAVSAAPAVAPAPAVSAAPAVAPVPVPVDDLEPFEDDFDEPFGEPYEAPATGPIPAIPPMSATPTPKTEPDLPTELQDDEPRDDEPQDDDDSDDPVLTGLPNWAPVNSGPAGAPSFEPAYAPVGAPEAPADPTATATEAQTPLPRRSGPPEDHDGLTVLSSDVVALRRQLPEWAGDAVPQLAVPTPRTPAPAKLLMSTGLVVSLNRPVLIGRAPQVTRVSNNEIPRLITVASPNQDISRTHAEVRMDGEDVVITDLRSTNGVLLLRQGQGTQRLHPGEPTVVEPGVVVDLGEGVTFLVEAGG